MLTYFIYTDIPGAGQGWTVAILATSRKDANEHLRAVWKGGKLVRQHTPQDGEVKADCGDITQAASQVLAK